MFEKLEIKDPKTVGFIVRLQDGWSDAFYVTKDELQLGENRIILGKNSMMRRVTSAVKCTCRPRDGKYMPCYCNSQYFYYSEKLDKMLVVDNNGIEIEEVEEMPDWAKNDLEQAEADKKTFEEQWLKDHPIPTPKPKKKKTKWERFRDWFKPEEAVGY